MDEDEYIENLDDEGLVNQSSNFPRQKLNNLSKNVPNALHNRSLSNINSNRFNNNNNNNGVSNKNNNNISNKNKYLKKNNLPKSSLNKGQDSKDSGVKEKLKQKNKPLAFLNRGKNNGKSKNNNNKSSNESQNNNNEEASEGNNSNNLIKHLISIFASLGIFFKVAIIVLIVILIIIIVIIVVVVVIFTISPIFGVITVGAGLIIDLFSIDISGNNSNNNNIPHKDEVIAYYEKLDEATKKYADSCDIYLDKSYINATLSYIEILSPENDKKKMYNKMSDNIDDVTDLMVDDCTVDYSIGGKFYNNLKNSNFLKNYYSSELKNIEEEELIDNIFEYAEVMSVFSNMISNDDSDDYDGDVIYSDGGYDGSVTFYAQTDYKQSFCGLGNATISSHGCGVTSMAMILSTFVDKKFTPIVVNEEARNDGYCSYDGTYVAFFKKSAERHNLGYQNIRKNGNKQIVLDALKSGNSLVIAHMGQGLFTNGGHYIILSKLNDNGEVYVLDPYHDVNVKRRNSGNGWYSFNDIIAKQVKSSGYHIITKR